MKWSISREKSHPKNQSTSSLQEKINYYCTSLDSDTKDIESIKKNLNLKNHHFEELREIVERRY